MLAALRSSFPVASFYLFYRSPSSSRPPLSPPRAAVCIQLPPGAGLPVCISHQPPVGAAPPPTARPVRVAERAATRCAASTASGGVGTPPGGGPAAAAGAPTTTGGGLPHPPVTAADGRRRLPTGAARGRRRAAAWQQRRRAGGGAQRGRRWGRADGDGRRRRRGRGRRLEAVRLSPVRGSLYAPRVPRFPPANRPWGAPGVTSPGHAPATSGRRRCWQRSRAAAAAPRPRTAAWDWPPTGWLSATFPPRGGARPRAAPPARRGGRWWLGPAASTTTASHVRDGCGGARRGAAGGRGSGGGRRRGRCCRLGRPRPPAPGRHAGSAPPGDGATGTPPTATVGSPDARRRRRAARARWRPGAATRVAARWQWARPRARPAGNARRAVWGVERVGWPFAGGGDGGGVGGGGRARLYAPTRRAAVGVGGTPLSLRRLRRVLCARVQPQDAHADGAPQAKAPPVWGVRAGVWGKGQSRPPRGRPPRQRQAV